MTDQSEEWKSTASTWFTQLRNEICQAFEKAESDLGSAQISATFDVRETERPGGGGGLMSVLRGGEVFEKVGVNVSTVHGELSPQAQAAMADRKDLAGIADDPRFWASGISLVAHMQNPFVPAVHMNTRMFWTPGAWWFGGGADLNPCIEFEEDTAAFHGVLKAACESHDPDYYARFKDWADRYFFIPHRARARGVGGIFYDDLNTGDWAADFAFTQDVGQAFLPAYLPILNRRQGTKWGEGEKDQQLIHRGLYAEYNLVYDRGTKFGLESGHDPEAVLMSLPPLAKWV